MKPTRRWWWWWRGLGVVLVLTGRTLADGPTPPAPVAADAPEVVVTQPDESKFPEISVYFELKRPDGSFLLDAGRDSFRVTEDGRERPILEFDAPVTVRTQPSTIVLVLDHSGSMREDDRMGALKRAVASFLQAMPAGSKIAVIGFSSQVRLICPFTTDRGRALAAVNELEADGGTRYFDAVAAALGLLADETGRRAILAMTDGKDTMSAQADLNLVTAAARTANLPVHTLGLGDDLDEASQALRRLATATRGQHYTTADAAGLGRIFEEIARRLGSTYRLTYATDRRIPDGTLRPIAIFYARAKQAGQAAIFIRGMVVPARGWSRLFLLLLTSLVALAVVPPLLRTRRRRSPSAVVPPPSSPLS